MTLKLSRRAVTAGIGASLLVNLKAMAQGLKLPSAPVDLNFVDVAGNLQLTQRAIETYRDAHPKLVSRISFSTGYSFTKLDSQLWLLQYSATAARHAVTTQNSQLR